MSRSQEFSLPQESRGVLLSVKPRFSELIVAGTKRVEFRRTWALEEVGCVAVYASSPIQNIVAVVEVESIVRASPTALWKISKVRGGGLTLKELQEYFDGKSQGVAVLLGRRWLPSKPLEPNSMVPNFRAPQSFRYLTAAEVRRLGKKVFLKEDVV